MANMAILPLDPTDPPRRLSLLLADARPSIIVVKCLNSVGSILNQLPEKSDVKVVGLNDVEKICRDEQWLVHVCLDVREEDVSHVYFTSGSTGRWGCIHS